ncbi:hypothetical protein [Azospirillum sp. Marseille-Q6669]
MIISLSDDLNAGLCPEALPTLNSNFEKEIHYKKHGFRHPFARYSTSIDSIVHHLGSTISSYEKVKLSHTQIDKDGEWANELISNQKQLLYTIAEHFDAIDEVIFSFFENKQDYLRNKRVKSFFSLISKYKDRARIPVNRMKHNGSNIRAIIFYGNGNIVPGYFIEGIVGEGFIGPDTNVHKDGNSAYSFARDLRLHIFHIYYISRQLSHLIEQLNKPVSPNKFNVKCYWIEDFARRINNIHDAYYFDEVKLPNPSIKIGKSISRTRIELTYRSSQPKPVHVVSIIGQPWRYRVHFGGDGVTDIFKAPYSGKEYNTARIVNLFSE